MQRHERQAGTERGVETNVHLNRATSRAGPHALTLFEAESLPVFRRDEQLLPPAQRRRVLARLDPGIKGIEAPARRETDRKLIRQLVDRRIVLHRRERREGSLDRVLPQAAVQELGARM